MHIKTPPSSGEVKNGWNYTSTPLIHLHSVHRNFTYYNHINSDERGKEYGTNET
jgi:hypothetical protein